MHIRPGLMLATLAAASWGAVITADALNWHVHIFMGLLVVAACATAFAWQSHGNARLRQAVDRTSESIDRMADAYTELARAVAELAVDPKKPDAGPQLRAVPAHGRHAAGG